jgi:transposase
VEKPAQFHVETNRPFRIIVTAGQVGDITQAPVLLEGQSGDAVLADKAYDSNAFRSVFAVCRPRR